MSSLLFFFAKLLHAKPKHASGEIKTRRILREKADCKQSKGGRSRMGSMTLFLTILMVFFFFLLFLTFLSLFCHPIVIKINN